MYTHTHTHRVYIKNVHNNTEISNLNIYKMGLIIRTQKIVTSINSNHFSPLSFTKQLKLDCDPPLTPICQGPPNFPFEVIRI